MVVMATTVSLGQSLRRVFHASGAGLPGFSLFLLSLRFYPALIRLTLLP